MTSFGSTIKTVLELDLASYSDVAQMLEENLSVEAVEEFEDQVQQLVDVGLQAVGLPRDEVVLATAGDNAILLFDNPSEMHRFAETVHQATRDHNRGKSVELARRWFRMGAATGIVKSLPDQRRIVGTTISRAVRLESRAKRGELLVDLATWDSLRPELQDVYGLVEEITGKRRTERYQARRCAMVPPEEIAQAATHRRQSTAIAAVIIVVIGVALVLSIFIRQPVGQNRPTAGQAPPTASPAAPQTSDSTNRDALAGTINVRVWDPDDPARRGITLSDALALPLRAGDQIRIEAETNQPAYLYVVWIAPDGAATPVYPWSPGDWSRIASEEPRSSLALPERTDTGWPMDAASGMETLVLLARTSPLVDTVPLPDLLSGFPEQTMQNPRSLVWLHRGDILVDPRTDRAPLFFNTEQIDDPVLSTQRVLTERLGPYFDVIEAVSFAKQGN